MDVERAASATASDAAVITWLRNADADEAAFLALVASEAGIARPDSCPPVDLVRVAVHDGRVSGFTGLALPTEPRQDGELGFLFVHEQWRGRGVGRLLLHDVHRSAQLNGAGGVAITAHPGAAGFFQRSGAVRVGTAAPSTGTPWSSPLFRLPGTRDRESEADGLVAAAG